MAKIKTGSYELSRCQPYQAELAQTYAEYKRSRCGRKTKLSDELKQKILNHLHLSWSPGMIAHEVKLATKSIYNWLNQGRIDFSLNDLPKHGVRQRRNVDQRSKYNQSLGRSIEQRPIYERHGFKKIGIKHFSLGKQDRICPILEKEI